MAAEGGPRIPVNTANRSGFLFVVLVSGVTARQADDAMGSQWSPVWRAILRVRPAPWHGATPGVSLHDAVGWPLVQGKLARQHWGTLRPQGVTRSFSRPARCGEAAMTAARPCSPISTPCWHPARSCRLGVLQEATTSQEGQSRPPRTDGRRGSLGVDRRQHCGVCRMAVHEADKQWVQSCVLWLAFALTTSGCSLLYCGLRSLHTASIARPFTPATLPCQ